MAANSVVESYLSASIESLFNKLDSREIIDSLGEQRLDHRLLKKLYMELKTIDAVLNDAEDRQIKEEKVRLWLNRLKDVVYEVEDLLDEIATDVLRCKLEAESQTSKIEVWNTFSTSRHQFKKGIKFKVDLIADRLKYIAKDSRALALREGLFSEKLSQRLMTSSLVNEGRVKLPDLSTERKGGVYGRDNDKGEITKRLLSDGASGDEICIITIVGLGGVGKTTLAQLVYNDNIVKARFDLKAWVYVSEEFDVFRITRTIFEAVTSSAWDIEDLQLLQFRLKERLAGKKFLLVLDNVWTKNYSNWNLLTSPLKAGAKGSKIIVTSRSRDVALVMRTVTTYYLKQLSGEDCWWLFAEHAVHNPGAHPNLNVIAKEIVKKCKGLPLVAKTLGGLLRSKDVEEWDKILNSRIWDLSVVASDILPALMLSYHYLPSHLKQCFAYCSIFPKNYEFEKEKLALLWMAEGFVQQPKRYTRMEEVGDEYFHDLFSRSFFQQSSGNKSCFVMHELLNDLAEYVSEEFCFILEDNWTHGISVRTRHLSYSGGNYDAFEKLKDISGLKCLRTFFLLMPPDFKSCQLADKVVHDFLLTQRSLRVLSLSHCYISELSDSIGNLKHLRYLDLSHTAIKRIPESVSTLYNLQTLMLSNCRSLTKLPTDMGKLINLRHLNIGGTALEEMPIQMGRLKSLQTLTNFVVGEYSGSRIYELGALLYLHGTLSILKLQNVVDVADASASNLKDKNYLEELVLEWSSDNVDLQNESDILEKLQPHTNLKRLTIRFYGGTRFPDWLGKLSFSNMVFLHLSNCKQCRSLPPLGQLPSLKELIIEGIDGVEVVGHEFYGTNFSALRPFQSLETLRFVCMLGWVEWISFGVERGEFPCLRELYIQRCPKFIKDLPKNLPSLTILEIFECPELELRKYNEVPLRSDDEATKTEIPNITHEAASKSSLRKNEIPNITHEAASTSSTHKTEIPDITHEAASKSSTHKTEIPDITHEAASKSSLHMTQISDIRHETASKFSSHKTEIPNITYGAPSQSPDEQIMTSYSQDILKHPSSSGSLKISDISQLNDLLPRLHSLRIEECDALESLPEEMADNCCLEHLYIISCCSLKSFPRGGLPTTLKTLYIRNCRNLEFSLPAKMVHQYALLERLCIGSSCDSLMVFPLGFFPKLRSLCIWGFANFETISIPEGLHEDLKSLDVLEITDCPKLVSFPEGGLLAPNLTSIWISNCKNLKSLPDRMHTLLPSLQVLSISKCPNLVSFPEGGLPSNLNFLCITFCNKLTPWMEWGMHRMASLSRFEIEGECSSVESFPEGGLLPPSLTSLRISRLSNLKRLDHNGLRCLTSLETLEINCCNKLRSFPVEGLPTSLSFLIIKECSLLKIRCQRDKGIDWPRIAHIPHIEIDEEVIS